MYSRTKYELGRTAATNAPDWQAPGWVVKRPWMLAMALVTGVVGIVAGSAAFLDWVTPELSEQARRQIATLILAAATVGLLYRWSAWRAIGATRWLPLRTLPLMAFPVAIAAWPLGFGIEGGFIALLLALVAELPNSFAEEALMRGVFVRAREGRRRWVTAVLSGILFGLLHLVTVVWGASVAEVVPLVVISSLFGIGYACMRMVTNSLWAPIALHALFNVSQAVGRGIDSVGEGPATLVLLIAAVVFPVYGLLLLRRKSAWR